MLYIFNYKNVKGLCIGNYQLMETRYSGNMATLRRWRAPPQRSREHTDAVRLNIAHTLIMADGLPFF